jgi:glycosyltransferase involved in cell wall biosynthesis
MNAPSILGIVLVRNEDRFLTRALDNSAGFCDRFLLFDNGSRDNTPAILEAFARRHPRAEVTRIRHPRASHPALEPIAGSPTWVFGLDGDELYDPAGLAVLRPRLLAGEFDASWMLMGHCLHTESLDAGSARGFMAPPSRSITKLYNFAAIDAWPGPSSERLHGGRPVFRRGFDSSRKRLLHGECRWEDSPLRCLHVCFLRRSSIEGEGEPARRNIDERVNAGGLLQRLVAALRGGGSEWKRERYRRGPLVAIDATPFF